MKASGSLALSIHNMYETLAISVPTVVDAARGRLTKEACDERLRSWSARIVEHNAMEVEVRRLKSHGNRASMS